MFRYELRNVEEVPQLELVILSRLAQACEPVSMLWDDEEMHGGLRTYVSERQAVIVLVDDVCRDLDEVGRNQIRRFHANLFAVHVHVHV